MAEPVDVYADQFQVTLGPYGCTLSFLRSKATPPPPGMAAQADRVATVRMSLQHLKVMTFLVHRQLRQWERDTGPARRQAFAGCSRMQAFRRDECGSARLDTAENSKGGVR